MSALEGAPSSAEAARGDAVHVVFEEEASPSSASAQSRQAAISEYMDSLASEDRPTYYSYSTFICCLSTEGGAARGFGAAIRSAVAGTAGIVAERLLALAESDVYLADERAYICESLGEEFPELALFRIRLDEAFAESPVHPGIWIETQRFADLRSLAPMRRELRRTGVVDGLKVAEVVMALLGLGPARR